MFYFLRLNCLAKLSTTKKMKGPDDLVTLRPYSYMSLFTADVDRLAGRRYEILNEENWPRNCWGKVRSLCQRRYTRTDPLALPAVRCDLRKRSLLMHCGPGPLPTILSAHSQRRSLSYFLIQGQNTWVSIKEIFSQYFYPQNKINTHPQCDITICAMIRQFLWEALRETWPGRDH